MKREKFSRAISRGFRNHRVVAILGPRQCGKTTLARAYASEFKKVHYFDLEDPLHLLKLENPILTLEELEGLIVIDEIQLKRDLFPVIRVLVDQKSAKRKFLILGSASGELMRQTSETLAGRIFYIELTPFSYEEVDDMKRLWLRGGFPRSYLGRTLKDSNDWRWNYIKTFLEKDIPQLGIQVGSETLRRFWTMLTAYHGNLFNASELGKSLGAAHTTIQHYMDILTQTFMVRQLAPWHENILKRQLKASKIYFRDSGLFHSLMRINSEQELKDNVKLGASWEGFALEEVIRRENIDAQDCYFWKTFSGAELDLMIVRGNERIGFEFKYADQPALTKSMNVALEDLKLKSLTVVFPGEGDFPLKDRVRAIGLKTLLSKSGPSKARR